MTIPFSEVKPASLKMRVMAKYPAAYRAGPGIAIEQTAGVVTTSVDFANLERDDITDPTTLYVGAWDSNDNIFKLVLGANLKGDQGAQGAPGPANASDYETRTLAAAATISAGVNYLRTAGYAAAGDGGGALYKKVVSLPAGSNGFQSADGAWWQYADLVMNVLAFGADKTGAANSASAINAAINAAGRGSVTGVVYIPPGVYLVNGGLNITEITQNLTIVGGGMGQNGTKIYVSGTASSTNAILDLTGSSSVKISDMWVDGFSGAANYGIILAASATNPSNVICLRDMTFSGKFQQTAFYIYHSSDNLFEHVGIGSYLPATSVIVAITDTNFLGASSAFTTITTTTAGQSGDLLFIDFQIHDISAPTGQTNVIALYIKGHFSPIKYIGGVIAGMTAGPNSGLVKITGTNPSAVTFDGVQFYGDTEVLADYAIFVETTVKGLTLRGSSVLSGVSAIGIANGVGILGGVIQGNDDVSAARMVSSVPGGSSILQGCFIDAQGKQVNLGSGGILSQNVILRPGTITTGTNTSNGLF